MYQYFIIPYLYEDHHVSGDTTPIIRILKLHWQPLVFDTWKVVVRVVGGQRPTTTRPTALLSPRSEGKTKPEAATAVVELLMMGVTTPETC
jgi:hypothetical protein